MYLTFYTFNQPYFNSPAMCGIFAYLNFCVPCERKQIFEILLRGLERLEYRGYDSAGLAVDFPQSGIKIFRQKGKVAVLRNNVFGEFRTLEQTKK